MDFSAFKLKDTYTFSPVHFVTGEAIEDMVITVKGADSREYKSVSAAFWKRVKGKNVSTEEAEQFAIDLCAACIVDWNLEEGDKPIPVGDKDFLKSVPLLREQITAQINNRENFSMASSDA